MNNSREMALASITKLVNERRLTEALKEISTKLSELDTCEVLDFAKCLDRVYNNGGDVPVCKRRAALIGIKRLSELYESEPKN